MITPRTSRWSQTEIASLVQAHSNGVLQSEEGAAAWGMAHNRSPEAMFSKLVDLGLERRRVGIKGEIQPMSDEELVTVLATRLAAKGASADNAAALLGLLKGALGVR